MTCARCESEPEVEVLSACGVIPLCAHCDLFYWACLCGRDELTGVIHAD